jgi:hypothetical protein
MKFGARLTYLATWLGMLAAGSWMLPVFTLGVAPRVAAAALAAPAASGSNDDGWTGSEVAAAWALATGSEYTPASQVLALESGADGTAVLVDRVDSEDGRSLGLSWFMVDQSLSITETAEEDADLRIAFRAEMVTGRVVGALEHPGYFSAIRFAMSIEVGSPAGQSEQFALLPFAAFQTEADAAAFHESMVEASQAEGEGGSGDGGILCVNPNWRGFNGVECCSFESALHLQLRACRLLWWAGLLLCVSTMCGVAYAKAKPCLTACLAVGLLPPAFAACKKACFWKTVVAAGGAYFLCQGANQLAYEACVRQRWAEYLANLASNGCPPKPGADAPVAEQAVSEADPLEKADTLVSEIE